MGCICCFFLRKGKVAVLLNHGKTDKMPPFYIGKTDKEILKTSDFFIKYALKTSDFFINWYQKNSDFLKIIVNHHAFIQIKALSLQKIDCTSA